MQKRYWQFYCWIIEYKKYIVAEHHCKLNYFTENPSR